MQLNNMYVPEWLVTPFDMTIDNGYESALEDELVKIDVNPDAKALFKS